MSAFIKEGVKASTVALPKGAWPTLLDFLSERFANIGEEVWRDRFTRGRVLDAQGRALSVDTAYCAGTTIHYFREIPNEPVIPFTEKVLFVDEHLIVVDKPPFLPVTPSGAFAQQTLLARLNKTFAGMDVAPLHRIDRHTSGLVLFSNNSQSRDAYHQLFRHRLIEKTYHAWAPPITNRALPFTHATRIVTGEPFFRSQEVVGEPNSHTQIEVLERGRQFWRYALKPITGRKHQLRVQLAGLGAAICNDPIYPEINVLSTYDDYQRPLKLLAHQLTFNDPITGLRREFFSQQVMSEPEP